MITALLAGIVAGYAIAVPVGAIAVYLMALGARHGWRIASAGALGAATVDGLYSAVAVFAGSLLAPALSSIREPLRIAAGIVLVLLGLWMLRVVLPRRAGSDTEPQPEDSPNRRRAYLTVLGITLVNPATIIYFAALVIGSSFGAHAGVPERLLFVVGVAAASTSWQLVLAGAGTALSRVLGGPRGRRWTAIVGGAIVILLGVKTGLGW